MRNKSNVFPFAGAVWEFTRTRLTFIFIDATQKHSKRLRLQFQTYITLYVRSCKQQIVIRCYRFGNIYIVRERVRGNVRALEIGETAKFRIAWEIEMKCVNYKHERKHTNSDRVWSITERSMLFFLYLFLTRSIFLRSYATVSKIEWIGSNFLKRWNIDYRLNEQSGICLPCIVFFSLLNEHSNSWKWNIVEQWVPAINTKHFDFKWNCHEIKYFNE